MADGPRQLCWSNLAGKWAHRFRQGGARPFRLNLDQEAGRLPFEQAVSHGKDKKAAGEHPEGPRADTC
jgi:hypothetical protein